MSTMTTTKSKLRMYAEIPPLPTVDPPVRIALVPGMPEYATSTDGRVWSCKKVGPFTGYLDWHEMKQSTTKEGYQIVRPRKGNQVITVKVHHLVLLAFVGPRPDGLVGCHNDDNKRNNTLINLRWDTQKANAADKDANGRVARGERSGAAKLTAAKVVAIRSEYVRDSSDKGTVALGKKYGVSPNTISRIVDCITWQHITEVAS